jgi:hypothetical protein
MNDLEAIMRDPTLATSDRIACPACDEMISILVGRNAAGEPTVDITHPQPPCSDFRKFVERLFARHRN